jgi:hypothetical protein
MVTAANSSLQTGWVQNNNSRGPRFSYSASGSGTVYYASQTGFDFCDVAVPAWIGCAYGGGTLTWRIWLRSDMYTKCEETNATGCYLAKRVFLHEAEHVALVNGEESQSATLTNMGGCPPNTQCSKPNTGWDSTTPRECDQAGLQMKYGMYQFTGQFADCLDHVAGAGAGGLTTVQTVSATSGTTCAGQSLSRSGRISTQSNSNYGRLSNIGIAIRTIQIDRKLHSSSTWTANWSSVATTSEQTADNWSRSFTENPAVTTTYDYRLHYLGEAGVAPSYSATLSLTFLKPCPAP